MDKLPRTVYTLIMETEITIDADLLTEAMRVSDRQTHRQMVEEALKCFIMQNRQAEARDYRGKLQWEGNLDEMRASRWSL
ncbi:hypothetical protein AGMMS49928_02690 [Spirochaetia bacterium]|nr:hypothetical protein AGMMS49928_02690 [Spirochaetia bacterium]